MVPGLAQYTDTNGEDYRILVGEEVLKQMDPSYAGKPVYVKHVDQVNLDQLQEQADGYVSESFYNKCDGKHWAKFIVVSDKAHDAIKSGWQLSNAYTPSQFGPGGKWHNVEYAKEVMNGEYEHLAIVPDPRYEESIILTPEEFKAYNSEKERELEKLANSKGDQEMSVLKFFKKTAVENSMALDLENTVVTLKNGSEKTIRQLVNDADEHEKKEKELLHKLDKMHMDSHVQVGNDYMSVNELVHKYNDLLEKHRPEEPGHDAEVPGGPKEENDDEMHDKKKNYDVGESDMKIKETEPMQLQKNYDVGESDMKVMPEPHAELKKKDGKHNGDEGKETEKVEKELHDKKHNHKHFEDLKNAPSKAFTNMPKIELSSDKVARGRARYGS